jgi:RNA polymerase sigma-70 factor (ECF subfamily)
LIVPPENRDQRIEQLDVVVRRHRGSLAASARAEGLTSEEAVECVQDALCAFVARAPQRGGEPEYLLPYLKAMVRNAARNYRRLHRRKKAHHDAHGSDELPAPGADAATLLVLREDTLRLRSCVAELCGVQRAAVMLRLLEEQSGEDAAKVLGVSRGHVDVLVHRAKMALRTCMQPPPCANSAEDSVVR